MKKSRLPKGWNEERVRRVIVHYEAQTEEALAEDEAALEELQKAKPCR